MVSIDHLHNDVKRRRSAPLQHTLLHPSSPALLVPQGHRRNAPYHIIQRWVLNDILQDIAVRRRNELDTPLRNGAGRQALIDGPDFVDDDDVWRVVFHRFYHHAVLL